MTSCLLSSLRASLKRGLLLKEIIRLLGRPLMSKWQNLLEAVSLTSVSIHLNPSATYISLKLLRALVVSLSIFCTSKSSTPNVYELFMLSRQHKYADFDVCNLLRSLFL